MSDNKKYYYMKVKENFFESDEMLLLESMPDGYLYSNILLKLYLRSLKDNGRLLFRGMLPYTPDVLSRVVRHNVGVVEKAITIFKQLGLVEILDNGAMYMLDIQNFIGESSSEGDRKRESRRRIEEEKNLLLVNSGQMSGQMSDVRPPELEIDLEIEKERKREKKHIADSDECGDAFTQFWILYPNKKGKTAAFKKWQVLWKKGIDVERVLQGTQSYINFCNKTDRPFKDGSTFVNQEGWNDDWSFVGGGSSKVGQTGYAAYAQNTATGYGKLQQMLEEAEARERGNRNRVNEADYDLFS